MFLIDWRRESKIKDILRKLARQRIATILPGDVWVIEQSLKVDDEVESALKTAYLRGWVDLLPHAFPSSKLTAEGELPPDWAGFTETKYMYRLTEGGWAVINRSHVWILRTFWVSFATLLATICFSTNLGARLSCLLGK